MVRREREATRVMLGRRESLAPREIAGKLARRNQWHHRALQVQPDRRAYKARKGQRDLLEPVDSKARKDRQALKGRRVALRALRLDLLDLRGIQVPLVLLDPPDPVAHGANPVKP